MAVRGTDDLAALATSFNEMAASLPEKMRRAGGAVAGPAAVRVRRLARAAHPADHDQDRRRRPVRGPRAAGAGRRPVRRAAAEPARAVRVAARRPAGDQPVRRQRGHPGRRGGRRLRPGPARRPTTRSSSPSGAARKIEFRLPAEPCVAEVDRPPGRAHPAQPARQRGRARRGQGRGGHRGRRPGRGRGRGPRPRRRAGAGRGHTWSSTGSGGPTRPGPGPPAAPASACPSPWRTPGCTAAGCRPGASRAAARCSG